MRNLYTPKYAILFTIDLDLNIFGSNNVQWGMPCEIQYGTVFNASIVSWLADAKAGNFPPNSAVANFFLKYLQLAFQATGNVLSSLSELTQQDIIQILTDTAYPTDHCGSVCDAFITNSVMTEPLISGSAKTFSVSWSILAAALSVWVGVVLIH